MKAADIINLIQIRNYASQSIDNLYIKMSSDEVRQLQRKASEIDKLLLKEIVSLEIDGKTK